MLWVDISIRSVAPLFPHPQIYVYGPSFETLTHYNEHYAQYSAEYHHQCDHSLDVVVAEFFEASMFSLAMFLARHHDYAQPGSLREALAHARGVARHDDRWQEAAAADGDGMLPLALVVRVEGGGGAVL